MRNGLLHVAKFEDARSQQTVLYGELFILFLNLVLD